MTARDPVARLMGAMTLQEKIGQLNLLPANQGIATGAGGGGALSDRLRAGRVGGVFGVKTRASARAMQRAALDGSRLRIPLLFAEDVIHGHRTVFPLPVALACSWDMALIAETAAFAAREAAEDGIAQVYAPMLDVARDPRWGRVAESPGEDPFLVARIAEAMTRGTQDTGVAACLKHFAAYGATQSGRDYDNASLAWEALFDVHLPPFAAGVRAGAASVMVAFNAVNRVPMHAHEGLIEGWLRGTLGFDGLVISDYTGVRELQAHGVGDRDACVLRALRAGVDMDMVGEDYLAALPGLAAHGLACAESGTTATAAEVRALIDRACARVLRFKQRLGLLDDPMRGLEGPDTPRAPSAEGRALARRAAAASAVLLKNEDAVLPLRPGARMALIGPLAQARADMMGTWAVAADPAQAVTLEEALAGRSALTLAKGCDLVTEPWLAARLNVFAETVRLDARPEAEMIAEAVAIAQAADVVVAAVGEAKEHAGESASRLAPELPAPQRRLLEALRGAGRPLVAVVFAGRPLALPEGPDAILYAWHGGTEGANGVADLLFGAAEPSGRLSISLPAHPGQTPLHHGAETTGRPHPGGFAKFLTGWLDLPDGPDPSRGAWPFGFGLGYAAARYAPPQADRTEARGEDDRLEVWVDVANAGDRPLTETVQLYLSDPVARIVQPSQRLIGFRRLLLAPGETARAAFTVTVEDLRYTLAPSLESAVRVWDPGEFILRIGPNSRDTQALPIRWAR